MRQILIKWKALQDAVRTEVIPSFMIMMIMIMVKVEVC